VRTQLTRLGIDDLKLFLNSQRELTKHNLLLLIREACTSGV